MSDELDNHVYNSLRQYESDLDKEALWQAVRPPRRKRRLLFWFMLSAGVLTVISWGALNIAEKGVNTGSGAIVELANKKRAKMEVSHTSKPAFSGKKNEKQLKNKSTQLPKSIDDQDRDSDLSPSTWSKIGRVQNETVRNGKPFSQIDQSFDTNQNQFIQDSLFHLDNREKVQEESLQRDSFILNKLRDSISMLDYSQLSTPAEAEVKIKSKPNDHWFLQMESSYSFIQRKLTSQEPSLDTWVEDRISSEETLEGLSLALGGGYHLNDKWQIRTAIDYTTLNVRFKNINITQNDKTVYGVHTVVYNTDNTIDSIVGPFTYTQQIIHEKQTYNSFRQLSIPLVIGYKTRIGKVNLLLEAGVNLRLMRSLKGEILTQSGGFQQLHDVDWYRNGLGYSMLTNVLAVFPLTENIEVMGGGSVQYFPQDFSKDTAPFKERYQLFGGKLGIRYKL